MFQHHRHGNVDVISGDDPLVEESLETVREVFEGATGHGQPHVVFDFARIPYVDSKGLELLLDLRDECGTSGGAMRLAAPNQLCHDVLHVTGLDREFDVYPDAVTAAGSFAR